MSQSRLTLFAREYCHLCHDMADALQPILQEFGAELDWVDVDQHPEFEVLYDELVPVLVANGQELCHYHLDVAAVRAFLEGTKVMQGPAEGKVGVE